MNTFLIDLDSSTFARTRSGALTGGFYVRINGEAFPEAGWNDFASTVLGWWCEAILRILDGTSDGAELYFMDGPFSMTFQQPNVDGNVFLELREGSRRSVQRVAEIAIAVLRDEVLAASRTVLEYCSRYGIESDNISDLKKWAQALGKQ